MIHLTPGTICTVTYTNWKGNTRKRNIIPVHVVYGKTKFHPEEQWLVEAVDCENKQIKHFALKDMVLCSD